METPDRTRMRRAANQAAPAGPIGLTARERLLVRALRHHVLVRDACLAPTTVLGAKLTDLDLSLYEHERPVETGIDGCGPDEVGDAIVVSPPPAPQRTSVVARMGRIRREIREVGGDLCAERRRLVLLETLTSLPGESADWSRSRADLLAEAVALLPGGRAEVARLNRRLAGARRDLRRDARADSVCQQGTSSVTAAVASSLHRVGHSGPGTAVAHAALLLTDRVPRGWSPSACGGVLLDPGPRGTVYLGTLVARHDLEAFADDLASLRVAATISPAARRYAAVHLPELACEIAATAHARHATAGTTAADMVRQTAALIDRPGRRSLFRGGLRDSR